jgi:hypothetical protein
LVNKSADLANLPAEQEEPTDAKYDPSNNKPGIQRNQVRQVAVRLCDALQRLGQGNKELRVHEGYPLLFSNSFRKRPQRFRENRQKEV